MKAKKKHITQMEDDLENLFSFTGLNFKNIKSNELKITQTLKTYTDKGWMLQQVVPPVCKPRSKFNRHFYDALSFVENRPQIIETSGQTQIGGMAIIK